ncbi:MAG: hypothetical protein ACP5I8_03210 [Phycisphaerae bacterium]
MTNKIIELGPKDQFYLDELGGRIMGGGVIAGIAALVLAAALGAALHDGWRQFLFSYLTAWLLFFVISASALLFVLGHHLFRASWSVVVRRLAEAMSCNFIPLLVLTIPLLLGFHKIFIWTHYHYVHSDPNLLNKTSYLNVPFFMVRSVIYFAFLIGLSLYFRGLSVAQDQDGSVAPMRQLRKQAGWGFLAVFWIVNFAGVDYVMSLQPKWLSYMEPGFFFAGVGMAIYTVLPLLAMWLQRKGRLTNSITVEHYHDLGKWLYGWAMFWAYLGFAQYMLIWYANVPKETTFFLMRCVGPWLFITLALLFGHFIVPFFGLMSRHVKRNKALLAFWCVWLLFFGYLDIFWQVQPLVWVNTHAGLAAVAGNHDPYRLVGAVEKIVWKPLQPMALALDVLCLVGIGGLWVAHTFYLLRRSALMPIRDPNLAEGLALENM